MLRYTSKMNYPLLEREKGGKVHNSLIMHILRLIYPQKAVFLEIALHMRQMRKTVQQEVPECAFKIQATTGIIRIVCNRVMNIRTSL